MLFCGHCGAQISDGSKFCPACGTPVAGPARVDAQQNPTPQPYAAPQTYAPYPQNVPPYAAVNTQPNMSAVPMPYGYDFSRIVVRYRCPNGHVFDGNEMQTVCPTCGAPLQKGGYIQLYRMGNYMGCAVGMGVYIDNIPFGHIANKQSIRVSVPFGPHKVHVTHTTTRACNDPVFVVTPDQPYVWCKAHLSAAGFKITVEPASPDTMPDS